MRLTIHRRLSIAKSWNRVNFWWGMYRPFSFTKGADGTASFAIENGFSIVRQGIFLLIYCE
jgi:hypothetical protein